MAAGLLETVFCRSLQGLLKLGHCFIRYRTPILWEGPGKLRELGALLKKEGINDCLVVTGAGMVSRGQAEPMLESFRENGIRYTLLAYDRPEPTDTDVELGYRRYVRGNCRSIVALGGGSRIDCAKAIAAKAVRPGREVMAFRGLFRVGRPTPPLVAVPTTAGAGSETTIAAIITQEAQHHKILITDPVLIPGYAVLDPELTCTLPAFTTAITGMDALTHGVEAYLNQTYNTALENRLAREAVRLIHGNLLTAVENGADLEARQNMQRGAFLAGRAFTRGCVGYVHALGHTLGGLYGVPHGLAMAVLLPHVLRQYGPAAHKYLARLAEDCGMEGSTDGEKANCFIRWIGEANKRMGIPDSFGCIRREDIPRMIAWARREANPLYPVPQVWGKADLARLLESVCAPADGSR